MSSITPPNVCGASPDPSRLAQQSLRAFWSWTPFAPFLGLKSPWLEIWSPHLRAIGELSRSAALAPGLTFAAPKAASVETAEAPAEAEAEVKAKPAAKAKAPKAAPAPVEAEAAPAVAAEAPAAEVEAEVEAKAKPAAKKTAAKAAPKAAPVEPPKAAKDLFDAPEASAPVVETPDAPQAEPSLVETFAASPEVQEAQEAAAPAQAEVEAAPAPAAEEAKPEAVEALAADDLTKVDGVGPATARRLQEQGVRSYADLAALTPEALIEIRRVGSLTITEDQAREIIASAAVLARPDRKSVV